MAGTEAVVCSVSCLCSAGFWQFVCFVLVLASLILACFEIAAFVATPFAVSSDLIFAARFVSSFAASAASKDVFWNDFGMSEVKPNVSE